MSPVQAEERREPALVDGRPEGLLEFELRAIIRDVSRVYSAERAREIVSEALLEELGISRRRPA